MEIYYKSTRNDKLHISASQAILQGLSQDGGLFVPSAIPAMPKSLTELSKMGYKDVAFSIMKEFFTDFSDEELRACIDGAYDEKFDIPEITRLVEADGAYFLELYHGSTIAFKDMALSILPYLMTTAAKKQGEKKEIVILTATSGDTGKAALAGFAGVEGTRIVVFYPKDGVSPIQQRQMATQKGDNVKVIGINGNFDQAQTGVKEMFNDADLSEKMAAGGFRFSSANSINIGRLIPQVVYYVFAYTRLMADGVIKEGDPINITVPTGNFGNILAAYYAKCMGLPVNKLICASNSNKVLRDFFDTGVYDKNREFVLTMSPSMDILVSSNLERLIYKIAGEDMETNVSLMQALSQGGKYEITPAMREGLSDFYGGYASEEETAESIKRIFEKDGYLIDTHTAVAAHVYDKYRKDTGDGLPTVIASTASPYKFSRSVMEALGEDCSCPDDLVLADALSKVSGVALPAAVEELKSAKIIHDSWCEIMDMKANVMNFLGI